MCRYSFEITNPGECILKTVEDHPGDVIRIPAYDPSGNKVVSLRRELAYDCNARQIYLPETITYISPYDAYFCKRATIEDIIVDPNNMHFSSVDGVLYSKNLDKLIMCPSGKKGSLVIPHGVIVIGDCSFESSNLERIVLPDTVTTIESCAFGNCSALVHFTNSVRDIHEYALTCDPCYSSITVYAPRSSSILSFAQSGRYKYIVSDYRESWNAKEWLQRFQSSCDRNASRIEVWRNTVSIADDGGYNLPGFRSVSLSQTKLPAEASRFYEHSFNPVHTKLAKNPAITVTSDDCLDVAHKWSLEGHVVCVLNMANRQSPGGGIERGTGAQEGYLFRCSDYHRFLFPYSEMAQRYNLRRSGSRHQYPLDRNYGGIYAEGVVVFRSNESSGYDLLEKPWKVNVIAVAGMNKPRTTELNGESRIAADLVESVKNKIRTILRIAIDNGQRYLVLGALGCGAYKNPPKHVAELFRDVLCEGEFAQAFRRICFAVQMNGTGTSNYEVFRSILHGYIPHKEASAAKATTHDILQIAAGRDWYAILRKDGSVRMTDIRTDTNIRLPGFRNVKQIETDADTILGQRTDGTVIYYKVPQDSESLSVALQSQPQTLGVWPNAQAISKCEGHTAILFADGTLKCSDSFDYTYTHHERYASVVEKWSDIKQVALTYEYPNALSNDGRLVCASPARSDFFNQDGKRIIQISAFGAYYTGHWLAALYDDGTVRAIDLFHKKEGIDAVTSWRNVSKVCCFWQGIAAFTEDGRVLAYPDNLFPSVGKITNAIAIAVKMRHIIVLTPEGIIIDHC